MCDVWKKYDGVAYKCEVKHDPLAKRLRHVAWMDRGYFFWDTKPKRKKKVKKP